jgi:hypothetical protein
LAGLGVPGLIRVTTMSPAGQSRADLSHNRKPGAAHEAEKGKAA